MAKVKLDPTFTSLHGHTGNYVHCERYGKQYMREYVKPHNPKTEKQQKIRGCFGEASPSWRMLSEEEKDIYRSKARNTPLSGFNIYVSEYMKKSKGEPVEDEK